MANFVSVVNDVLSVDGILFGDDDAITSFTSQQHRASIRLAKQAVQQELAALVADQCIPYEKTSATLTVSSRLVTLPTDFVRMQDEIPYLLETDASDVSKAVFIQEFPGGESKLRSVDINYREKTGKPYYWYWPGGTTKQLGFYSVPQTTYYYRVYYEKDVSVTNESDTIPLVSETEVRTFVDMAARRFKYLRSTPTLREQLFPAGVERDPVILGSRNTLTQLLRHKPPRTSYGRRYR